MHLRVADGPNVEFLRQTARVLEASAAAPSTLIDGDKLIVLIEYGIGVLKRTLEVLAVDADVFADLEGEA